MSLLRDMGLVDSEGTPTWGYPVAQGIGGSVGWYLLRRLLNRHVVAREAAGMIHGVGNRMKTAPRQGGVFIPRTESETYHPSYYGGHEGELATPTHSPIIGPHTDAGIGPFARGAMQRARELYGLGLMPDKLDALVAAANFGGSGFLTAIAKKAQENRRRLQPEQLPDPYEE